MRAAALAQEAGIPVLLDPAPAPQALPPELYRHIDILTPNEVEASQLVGFPVRDRDSAQAAARQFREWGVNTAIITLGERGVWCSSPEGEFWLPAPQVQVVDTVAAGDAFNGALIAALYAHEGLETALQWGVTAGTLSVMQAGAQNSLPDRDLLLKSLPQFGFPNSAA
jgi:ribokinase